MATFLLVLIALVTVAIAQSEPQSDELEDMAMNILSSIHSHMGGESGQNSLYTFVSNSEFVRQSVMEVNRTRRERIEEGLGSRGITFVSVTKGKKQVNVTTQYGVGAGAVINVKEHDDEVDNPSLNELHLIVDPFYESNVNQLIESNENDDAIHVHLGSEGHTDFRLREPKIKAEAKVAAGFRVGAKTTVTKKG